MKPIYYLVVLAILLTSCTTAQSSDSIATSVAATVVAQQLVQQEIEPTSQMQATEIPTIIPTITPKPTRRPTVTRMPTFTPRPNVGSYEQPVTLGKAYSFTLKDEQDFELSIIDVLRGDPAWDMLYDANQFNDPAPSKMEWVCFLVHLEYTQGPSGITLDMDKYWFSTVTKGSIEEIPFYVSPEPEFEVSVLAGGMGEGWLCGHLYTDDTNPMVVFGHTDNKPGWYFSLVTQ